jgi:hypothetical protein
MSMKNPNDPMRMEPATFGFQRGASTLIIKIAEDLFKEILGIVFIMFCTKGVVLFASFLQAHKGKLKQ